MYTLKTIQLSMFCTSRFCYIVLTNIYNYYIFSAKNFMKCNKSDPKLNECLTNGFNSAIPHLAKGKKITYFVQ